MEDIQDYKNIENKDFLFNNLEKISEFGLLGNEFRELDIRINKLMSKKFDRNNIIKISNSISFDMEYEELIVDGIIKRLRKKERRLLSLLLQNVNNTVTNEMIENYVWENEIKESYPIRQLINDLRKVFDNGEKFIFMERGLGYRFEIKD